MKRELAEAFARDKMRNDKWNSFIKQFEPDALNRGYFLDATFELTAFCTLKCPMCYVRIDKDSSQALNNRPCSCEQWIEMARQFRDQGGLFLLITGGEAMMRPDFPEIYSEISRMGLYISIFTNGTTVDDKILELLKKRPPAMMGLTLYGASENTYKKFGGNEGSFKRAVDGLDRLLTIPNLALDVRFTICSENYLDLKDVFELGLKRNKLISVDYGTCAPVRGAVSCARKLRLSEDQKNYIHKVWKDIADPVLDVYEKLNVFSINSGNDSDPEEYSDRGMWCKGGKVGVYIAWDGRMYPCDQASFPYTFPLIQGFKAAALDIRQQVDHMLLPEKCLSCANRKTSCNCIPKALNEMMDCSRSGEECNYLFDPSEHVPDFL